MTGWMISIDRVPMEARAHPRYLGPAVRFVLERKHDLETGIGEAAGGSCAESSPGNVAAENRRRRDEAVFERPNEFRIDRKNARDHLSFGRGVHFCMGSRIAEMQLRVLWEETNARFRHVEVVGEPVPIRSNFVKGYSCLPVRLHRH